MGEVRFSALTRTFPEEAEKLLAEAELDAKEKYQEYKNWQRGNKMGNVKMQKVDLCVIQDNELAQVFLKTEKKPAVATVVVIDQTVPPNSPEVSGLHKALREKAEKENIPCYYGKGMCGKLLADGLLKAGERAVTCDKAAGAAGAIGAQVTCADPTQLKQVLETGELLLEEPENGALKETVKLTGKLLEGLSAKDLALSLVKELGAENLAGKLLSLTGDTLEDMELSEKWFSAEFLKSRSNCCYSGKEAEERQMLYLMQHRQKN